MPLHFYKFQGTGNDFIMVDDRKETFPAHDTEKVEALCDRRFGIGADGLILLRNHPDFDFEMVYYNSDGRTSTMCGNGGRCIAAFARDLGIKKPELSFLAVDGPHKARFEADKVALQMVDVKNIDCRTNDFVINTGSPHYVSSNANIGEMDLVNQAKKIRYNEEFSKAGINVNFIEPVSEDTLKVRTYERGVEDETYSCGTGVVASAIAHHAARVNKVDNSEVEITIGTKGGELKVKFNYSVSNGYSNIWLIGPAEFVFEGEISL